MSRARTDSARRRRNKKEDKQDKCKTCDQKYKIKDKVIQCKYARIDGTANVSK